MTPEIDERAPRRRRRGVWWALGVILLLAIASAVVVPISLRYAQAQLRCACVVGWTEADGGAVHRSDPHEHAVLAVPERSGRTQGLYVEIVNDSAVSQEVLGLPAFYGLGRQARLAASSRVPSKARSDFAALRYRPLPVSLAPGEARVLRYTFTNNCLTRGSTATMDRLELRTRAGLFSTTQSISFGNTDLSIVGSGGCRSGGGSGR